MASQNNETPKNLEIGEYKTPEALAQALEEKSKGEIAKKIRKIAEQVKGESIDLREKLKDALSDSEQTQIREVLSSTSISSIFDKGMSEVEIATQKAQQELASVVWGAEATKAMGKFEWFLERFDNAGDVYKKVAEAKGWMAWTFAGIMAAIMYFLTGKAPEGFDFSWGKKWEKKERGKENSDNEYKYIWWVKILYILSWDKSKRYISSMLLQDEVKSKSFNELQSFYSSWKDWVSKKLWLTDKWSDEQVYESLKILIENEKLLHSIVWKTNPEWKKWKIEENLIKINISWGSAIEKIIKKVEDINFSTNPIDAISQLRWISIFSLNNIDGEISFWELDDRKHLITDNISNISLIKLLWSDELLKEDINTQKNRLYWITDESDKEKWFIDTILAFRKNIAVSLSWLFWEDKRWAYKSFFDKNWLSMQETIELYMLTWWKTNINELNGLEKSGIYLKLWKIAWKDPSFRGEFFDKNIIEWIKNWTLPEEVITIFWSIFSKVSEKIFDSASAALKELWEAIPTKDKVIIWGVLWISIMAMIYFAPLRIVWLTAITAMITMAITSSQAINKSTGNVYTKEEIDKILKDLKMPS